MSWLTEYDLDPDDPRAVAFHRYYYESGVVGRTTWRGVPIGKCPMDLITYAAIIHETGATVIVEMGTNFGGSALFFADVLFAIGNDQVLASLDVISVDTFSRPVSDPTYQRPWPENGIIKYIAGDSTDPRTREAVVEVIHRDRITHEPPAVMVVLDSRHDKAHVLKELDLYAPLVTKGCYLVVEDTNLNGHPVAAHTGPGPAEALAEWFVTREVAKSFQVDRSREKFGISMSPKGWLRRIA